MTTAVQRAPRLTSDDAARIVAELYGLSVSAAPLPSERDQNFYCKAGNDQFVLKIANSEQVFEFLELQNRLSQFRAGRDIALEFPRVVKTRNGENIAQVSSENGNEHFVRLLTWLDGVCFAKAESHNRKLLASLGRVLAQRDRALVEFDHPAAHRSFYWDLRNANIARELNALLPDSRRPLVARFFDEWERIDWSRLRFSVIHNDANDYNILVNEAERRVTAIL